MNILAKMRALPPTERMLLAEAMVALAAARLVIAVFPFRFVAGLASRRPTRNSPEATERARHVKNTGWALRACARRVPWRAKCFEQGLAAMWMLRRDNIGATLHFGAMKRSDGFLAAHVWVRVEEIDVVGCENSGDFAELACFPPRN